MINTSAASVYRGDTLFPRSTSSTIALAILLALPSHGPAQSTPPAKEPNPQTTTPTLHVNARETIVDVTVTDSKGNAVHGLTRDDFTVKEDNKPQPIRSFHEFDAAPTSLQPLAQPSTQRLHQPPALSPRQRCQHPATGLR